MQVQVLDADGHPWQYIFDVFVNGSYFGDAAGNPSLSSGRLLMKNLTDDQGKNRIENNRRVIIFANACWFYLSINFLNSEIKPTLFPFVRLDSIYKMNHQT